MWSANIMGSAMGKADKPLTGQLGLLPGFEARASHFFETPYVAVERLLAWGARRVPLSPRAEYFVDPCAGDGAIVSHVTRYAQEHPSFLPPLYWHVVEMRDVPALGNVLPSAYDGYAHTVETPCRIQDANGSHRLGGVGITNLPWYPETIGVVESFWDKYPNAWLIGLLCTQFCKDGNRPLWYQKHMPEYILRHGGRMSFAPDGSKYPWPVEWNIWRPAGEPGRGLFDILLAEDTETP